MRLDIHQRAAIWWIVSAMFVFGPVIDVSPRADAGRLIAWAIVVVTACIAGCPILLKWRLFRALFCWTDAMSDDQRAAWSRRNLPEYYRIAGKNGYIGRVKPYIVRILLAGTPGVLMPTGSVGEFVMWYPIGVLVVAMASLPWSTLFRKRQEK